LVSAGNQPAAKAAMVMGASFIAARDSILPTFCSTASAPFSLSLLVGLNALRVGLFKVISPRSRPYFRGFNSSPPSAQLVWAI
jgi:hypothetical protein